MSPRVWPQDVQWKEFWASNAYIGTCKMSVLSDYLPRRSARISDFMSLCHRHYN